MTSFRATATVRSAPTGRVGVRAFSTGAVRGKRRRRGIRRYMPAGWSDSTLPVNVFAIEHPEGVCLFDTGQSARAAEPGYFPWWFPFFRLARFELGPEDEAAAQLSRAGIDPDAIRWVVLSHMHTDHAGGIHAFSGAEVLVSRAEWQRATDLPSRLRLRGYLPQYWPEGVHPRLIDFDGPPIGPFPGSHDVAGDRRLLLVPTPGHSVGHMALLVRDPHGGVFLAGDLAESAEELGRRAPELAAFCSEEGVRVLTSHDPEAVPIAADRPAS
jgi:glyoxylase-like metal-dependent hydrolase (beta-lactamase superfamily II)